MTRRDADCPDDAFAEFRVIVTMADGSKDVTTLAVQLGRRRREKGRWAARGSVSQFLEGGLDMVGVTE